MVCAIGSMNKLMVAMVLVPSRGKHMNRKSRINRKALETVCRSGTIQVVEVPLLGRGSGRQNQFLSLNSGKILLFRGLL